MLALAGCQGDIPQDVQATPIDSMETPAPSPVPGGELTCAFPAGQTDTHPLTQNTREMNALCGLVFEGLIAFDAAGAIQPSLAQSWELDAATGEWTFELRQTAVWQHNGRQISADDVIFTLDMIKELGEKTPYGYALDNMDSWRKNDDGKLVIKGKTSFYGLLGALSFPILPSDGGYAAELAPRIMTGTGPYKVTSCNLSELIVFEANENWWRKEPYIPVIRAIPVADNATAISSLVFEQLDALQTSDLTVRQYREAGDANTYEYTTRQFEFISVNSRNSYLQDKRLRQAIHYALDRQEITSYVYVNHAIAVESHIPPDSWLYGGSTLEYSQSSVDLARDLISQCGWQDGDGDGYWDIGPDGGARELALRITVNMDDKTSLRRDTAHLVAAQLAAIGIRAEVDSLSWEDYLQELERGAFDLAMVGVYMNPAPDWDFLLHSLGDMNYGAWQIDSLDAVLGDVKSSATAETLKGNVDRLQEIVIDELPIISLYFRTHTLLTGTDILGVGHIREENAFDSVSSWYFVQ